MARHFDLPSSTLVLSPGIGGGAVRRLQGSKRCSTLILYFTVGQPSARAVGHYGHTEVSKTLSLITWSSRKQSQTQ